MVARAADQPVSAVPIGSATVTVRRILVIGGGVGGLTVTRRLERLFAQHSPTALEIVLVSRENFFRLSPLLFEACSGVLELRHCAQPIRPCLRRARFIEAAVEEVDVERRIVRAVASDGREHELVYDQLVVALGASTNERLITAGGAARRRFSDSKMMRPLKGPSPVGADSSTTTPPSCG